LLRHEPIHLKVEPLPNPFGLISDTTSSHPDRNLPVQFLLTTVGLSARWGLAYFGFLKVMNVSLNFYESGALKIMKYVVKNDVLSTVKNISLVYLEKR